MMSAYLMCVCIFWLAQCFQLKACQQHKKKQAREPAVQAAHRCTPKKEIKHDKTKRKNGRHQLCFSTKCAAHYLKGVNQEGD